MAKPFETGPFESGFPGQAAGKGNAPIDEDNFNPQTPPVNPEDHSGGNPVEPTTGGSINLSDLIPTIPAENVLEHSGLTADDLPDDVPDFLDFF